MEIAGRRSPLHLPHTSPVSRRSSRRRGMRGVSSTSHVTQPPSRATWPPSRRRTTSQTPRSSTSSPTRPMPRSAWSYSAAEAEPEGYIHVLVGTEREYLESEALSDITHHTHSASLFSASQVAPFSRPLLTSRHISLFGPGMEGWRLDRGGWRSSKKRNRGYIHEPTTDESNRRPRGLSFIRSRGSS